MRVWIKPFDSSALRIAPILPSIMSLGAMMSTPASAWHRAWRTSMAVVSSFMM